MAQIKLRDIVLHKICGVGVVTKINSNNGIIYLVYFHTPFYSMWFKREDIEFIKRGKECRTLEFNFDVGDLVFTVSGIYKIKSITSYERGVFKYTAGEGGRQFDFYSNEINETVFEYIKENENVK